MKRRILITAVIFLACLLTSCVSYLGAEHLAVMGSGDNRYIDYGSARYYCAPEESEKSGYWYPKEDSENMTYIGFSKEKFHQWTVVTRFYFFDNGSRASYIHGSPYYYFPEGVSGFPPVEAGYVDALLVGGAEIDDRQIIEGFMALQDGEGTSRAYSDLEHVIGGSAGGAGDAGGAGSAGGAGGARYEDITLYNKEYCIVRPFLIGYDSEGCWVPVFKQAGFPYIKIPDELYAQIVDLVENS